MSKDDNDSITVRPAIKKLGILSVIILAPFYAILIIIGLPFADLMSDPIFTIGLLMVSLFWVVGFIIVSTLIYTVCITKERIKLSYFPVKLDWCEAKVTWTILPSIFYALSSEIAAYKLALLPGPWVVTKRKELIMAIEQFAPIDHSIRKRIVGKETN